MVTENYAPGSNGLVSGLQGAEEAVRKIEVQPPLDVIRLSLSCSVPNGYVSLPCYWTKAHFSRKILF